MLPFKGMMLDVEDVSDEAVEQFEPRLAALICSLKYARNPDANRTTFSHIVDRVHAELPKEDSLDLLHQMDVYLNGWVFQNFMEAFKMDFIRPNYRTVGDVRFDEGVESHAAETARKMLAKNKPMEEIVEFSGLTEDCIREIQAEMKKS